MKKKKYNSWHANNQKLVKGQLLKNT